MQLYYPATVGYVSLFCSAKYFKPNIARGCNSSVLMCFRASDDDHLPPILLPLLNTLCHFFFEVCECMIVNRKHRIGNGLIHVGNPPLYTTGVNHVKSM